MKNLKLCENSAFVCIALLKIIIREENKMIIITFLDIKENEWKEKRKLSWHTQYFFLYGRFLQQWKFYWPWKGGLLEAPAEDGGEFNPLRKSGIGWTICDVKPLRWAIPCSFVDLLVSPIHYFFSYFYYIFRWRCVQRLTCEYFLEFISEKEII